MKFEQPEQPPVSSETLPIVDREAQAESMMGPKEAELARARESLIENLRVKTGLDSVTFDEVVSSMNFGDLDRVFEFKARGHKVSGTVKRAENGAGGYSEIENVLVDDVKIEKWTGLDKFVDRYKSVILGL